MGFRDDDDMRFPKGTRVMIGENVLSLKYFLDRGLACKDFVAVEIFRHIDAFVNAGRRTTRYPADRRGVCAPNLRSAQMDRDRVRTRTSCPASSNCPI